MQILLQDPLYRDLPNPIQGPEDMAIVKRRHIPTRFLHTKDDGTSTLHVMCAPDLKRPFDLKQIAQYALIYSWLGLENTWQGIAVDFAYCMHWQTLFGFALCRALCANSAGKTTIVQQFALVMACPGLYREVVAAYAAANPTQPFVAQFGANLEIRQVHVPDNQTGWIMPTYVNDEHLQRLVVYGTPPTISNWDGWQEISEEDHYRLLFKHADKMAAQQDPEATGLYYYIGMDPNVGHLWKRTPAHDATAAGGPLTPPKMESAPHPPAINIAQPETATTMEAGRAQMTTGTG
ncbi:hypothetical protein J132_07420 [Termitomyces sp. J132]|nr:hypothetical protein J132_07420 [Termitomyces sp. J132]